MDEFSILNPVWIELISMNVSRLMLWQFVRWFKLELTIHSLLNSSENKIITKMVRSDKCTELTSAAPIFRWSSPQSNFDWAKCFIMSFIFNYLRVVLLLSLFFPLDSFYSSSSFAFHPSIKFINSAVHSIVVCILWVYFYFTPFQHQHWMR